VFAGVSALVASRLASRFGLVKTMVYTHLPSNILLTLVPLMPNLPWRSSYFCCASVSVRWMYRPGGRSPWPSFARKSDLPPRA
jgi:hypothetical protein